MIKKIFEKFSPVVFFIIGVIFASGFFLINNLNSGIETEEAGEKAIKFINERMISSEMTASLINISEENEIYKMTIEINGEEYESYVSRDGNFLFPEGIRIDTTNN